MSLSFKPKNSFKVLQMSLAVHTNLFLSLKQEEQRDSYNFIRVFLARVRNQSLEYQGGFHGNEKIMNLECNLSTGTYLVLVEICDESEKQPQLLIETNGDNPVKIEALEISHEDFMTLQSASVISYCKKTSGIHEINYEKEGTKEIRRFFGHVLGIVFLYYVNYSEKYELVEKVTKKSNMKSILSHPFNEKENKSNEFPLLVGKEMLIIYKSKQKEDFDPDVDENFEFDSKLNEINHKDIPNPDLDHLYFDENILRNIINFDHLKKASIKAKNLIENEEGKAETPEEEKKAESKAAHLECLEIENEQYQLDQNELLESLMADDRDEVLSCETSAISCFDWLIGKRITNWIEVLMITSTFSMFLTFMQSILRPNILDALIYVTIISQLVTKTISRVTISVAMGMLIYSFLIDFVWILLFNTVFSGEDLVVFSVSCPYYAFKIMAVVLTFLNILGKIWLFMVLWRFRVNYRKMKRLSEDFHKY